MSFVHVPFETINELLSRFHSMDFTNSLSDLDACNLVLIDPRHYFGSYGGIFNSLIVSDLKKSGIPFLSSPLLEGHLDIVWWSLPTPPYVGDLSLMKESRVAVTPDLFRRLTPDGIRPSPKSSYFSCKTDLID